MAGADRCIMCGEIVPEGRMVCLLCEKRSNEMIKTKTNGEKHLILNFLLMIATFSIPIAAAFLATNTGCILWWLLYLVDVPLFAYFIK